MIIETIVASVAAITIAGTWLGLRFAERAEERESDDGPPVDAAERKRALATVERCMGWDSDSGRAEVRALLACRPHVLPPDVRARAERWSRE